MSRELLRPALAAGADLGASRVRVVLLEAGRIVANAERPYAPPPPPARRSLAEVWATAALAFQRVAPDLLARVDRLAFTGLRGAVVGVDPLSGRTTAVYPDVEEASLPAAEAVAERLGASAVALTGCPASPLSGLPKLLLHGDQAPLWTSLPDALAWRATGELWLSTPMALRLGVLTADGRDVSSGLLRRLGFDPGKLAPLAPSGAPLGALAPAAAAQLGLPPGVQVVAAPGDLPCALLAAGRELGSSGHLLLACLGTTTVAITPAASGLAAVLPTDVTYEILGADLPDGPARAIEVSTPSPLAARRAPEPLLGDALPALAERAATAIRRAAAISPPDVVVLTGRGAAAPGVAARIADLVPHPVVTLADRDLAARGAALVAAGLGTPRASVPRRAVRV